MVEVEVVVVLLSSPTMERFVSSFIILSIAYIYIYIYDYSYLPTFLYKGILYYIYIEYIYYIYMSGISYKPLHSLPTSHLPVPRCGFNTTTPLH